jgi:hypothetical protein
VVRDARRCRAPHHEELADPHPEERALARVSKDEEPNRAHQRVPRRGSRPGYAQDIRPERTEGVGNAGWQAHPQPCVQMKKARKQVTTVAPAHPAFPHANGFNGFLRALPGDRALLPPSQATMRKHCRQLDASIGASGPHDFAVRLKRHSSKAPRRPPHPAPTSVTIAKRPSFKGAGRRRLWI